jgi:hypothetical protein
LPATKSDIIATNEVGATVVKTSAPRYTGLSETADCIPAISNKVGDMTDFPTRSSVTIFSESPVSAIDTGAGAKNRICSRANHSLPGTPV